VPTLAIVTYGVVACALAVTGSFQSLIILANITALLMYLLCCLAVLGLRRRTVEMAGPPLRVPGGAAVPWIASAAILGLLSTTTWAERLAVAIALAVASGLYVVKQKAGGRRKFVEGTAPADA
jgi:amino acid transporter